MELSLSRKLGIMMCTEIKNDFDKIAELISEQLGEKIANNDSTPSFYSVASEAGSDKKIVKIMIKGGSGYCCIDDAYDDKITLTESSISYEYIPHPMSQSETNVHRKWSYKTDSPLFKSIFGEVAARTPEYLYNNDKEFACDIGPTIITATFEDKSKETVNYFSPSELFYEYFQLIKRLVPPCEDVPEVIKTRDDYEE